jgi:hypothetical protein
MKNTLLTLLVITMAGRCGFGQAVTPQVINTTGGTYTHDYYMLDWSVGEMTLVNQMHSSQSNFIITNGFLQPFTQDLNFNNNRFFGADEIFILPNPTRNILEIDFRTSQKGTISLRLFDVLGRILLTNSFYSYGYGQIQKIDLTEVRAGSYILRIELNPEQGSVHKIGSYKIIKL